MIKRHIDDLKYSDIVSAVDTLDARESTVESFKLAITANVILDTIIPYIKYLCYQEGIHADIYIGDYDNVLQDALSSKGGIYKHSPEMIIVCLKMESMSETLGTNFANSNVEQVNSESSRITGFIDAVLQEFRKRTRAVILLHNFEVPAYPVMGILDYQSHQNHVYAIRQINTMLVNVAAKYESVYIVDVDLLQSRVGYKSYFDQRLWNIGKAPYTREACKEIAKEYVKFIRALKGKNKKCLVLDCDNTLWGGIIGEDGINHIKIGLTHPGSAFREFQQVILNLYSKGVLLAICSKNNENDVLEVLEKHPDMVLRSKHFAAMRINWKGKAENLQDIARELNIGLDSLVFVDDSAFEINMVRQMVPEVSTIELPRDPSLFKDTLSACGLFDTLSISDEDRRRNEMYRSEYERNRAKSTLMAAGIDDYYRYLEMKVKINKVDDFTIPRVSQLTQRTNQFNLTTRRYTEVQIKALAESADSEVLYLQLEDRFGDSGIVGTAILKYHGKEMSIDSFLLSCRVIGRGVEDVLLKVCMDRALKRGYKTMNATYVPTNKNSQVATFYTDHNFINTTIASDAVSFSIDLADVRLSLPSYFKTISVDGKIQEK
jgi:FkbH-like protein